MTKILRRDVIKGAAALSAVGVALQTGCCGPKEAGSDGQRERALVPPAVPPAQLNVVLHGVLALLFDYQAHTLTVFVPQVGGHVYAAGQWTVENSLDADGSPYVLDGAWPQTEMPPPPIGGSVDAIIDWTRSGIATTSSTELCKLQLPIPDDMRGLRHCVNTSAADFFQNGRVKKANMLDKVLRIPLVHVLIYKKLDANPLVKPPTLGNWKIGFDPADGVARLHVFAEPAFPMNDPTSHVNDAMSQVNKLFKPNLDLLFDPHSDVSVPTGATPTLDPKIKYNEQLSLDEHRALCDPTPFKVTKVRNCMGLVVVHS